MNAGSYDIQITIQKRGPQQEAQFGTQNGPWQSIHGSKKLWARALDARPSRNEAIREGLAVARNTTTLWTRYRSDVDSSMRVIIHGDRGEHIYQIIGGPAEVGGRKKEIELVLERYSS